MRECEEGDRTESYFYEEVREYEQLRGREIKIKSVLMLRGRSTEEGGMGWDARPERGRAVVVVGGWLHARRKVSRLSIWIHHALNSCDAKSSGRREQERVMI